MTPPETIALVHIAAVAHDRSVPDGMAEVWHATLGDLPFGLAREGLMELLKTSPYWPKPADIRERARLVKVVQDREVGKAKQLEGRRAWVPSRTPRSGAEFIGHVLGRLKDAGQSPSEGIWLGQDRARTVALGACREYLARTTPEHGSDPLVRLVDEAERRAAEEAQERACSRCYRPTTSPDLCDRCQPGGTT